MKSLDDTYFDPATDGFTPVTPGIYPAHVVEFDTRDFENGSIVFNLTFKIAEEAAKLEVDKLALNGNGTYTTVPDTDGNNVKVKATNAVGKTYRSQGVWLTPKPAKGEGWRNRTYNEFFSALGIEFQDDKGKVKLAHVEKDDVIGRPALVKLGEDTYEVDGETRKSMKVFNAWQWTEGVRMSQSELEEDDLPF